MMSEAEVKASRKETNHRYYMNNHAKWVNFYPKSKASQTGTGNLGSHRLLDENQEFAAIEKELKHLGLKSVRTKVYDGGLKK